MAVTGIGIVLPVNKGCTQSPGRSKVGVFKHFGILSKGVVMYDSGLFVVERLTEEPLLKDGHTSPEQPVILHNTHLERRMKMDLVWHANMLTTVC